MQAKKKNSQKAESKKPIIDEDEELDKYITNNFNNEIYQDLIGGWKDVFYPTTPLQFFRELYFDFNWILENKNKPRVITEYFKKKPFHTKVYLLEKLENLLQRKLDGKDKPYGKVILDIANNYSESEEYKQIKEAKENIGNIRYEEKTNQIIDYVERNFFDEVLEKLKTLPKSEIGNYLRGKHNKYIQLSRNYRETFETHKKFNPSKWYLEMMGKNADEAMKELAKEAKEKKEQPKENLYLIAEERGFTTRQKVLALLVITFGKYEVPDDVTKERVAEFFHFLTGRNKKNISDLLSNPTKVKEDSKKSIQDLCKDLHVVRVFLEKLGLSDAITQAISEIDFLINELDEKK